ncbi:MAG TPA: MASE1 domain-containing protein [Vicinamibacterales bacterium]
MASLLPLGVQWSPGMTSRAQQAGWYLLQQLLLTALVTIATRTGTFFTGSETGVSWLWPAAGINLASLTLLGLRAWPAILIGAVVGRAGTPHPETVWLLGAIDTVEAFLAAALLRAWPGFRSDLSRLGDAFALVIAMAISASVGAVGGALVTAAIATPGWPSVGRGLTTWMVGDGMGALLVAPPVMAWWRYRRSAPPSASRLIELGALTLALMSAGMVAYFASVRGDVHSPLEYLPFPVAIWAAMRFGVRGATAATLMMSGVALAGHVILEPAGTAAPTERETLLIQASLAVGALTALLVGAVTTERDETMRALGESEERATALFAQAPDAIFILDGERPHLGRLLAANPAAGDLHGISPSELVGRHILDFQTVSPREELVDALERVQNGERVRIEISHTRRDGTTVDVEMHASAFQVGRHRYLLAFDRDVTERRRSEAERARMEQKLQETQKLESLGLLAGGIAHDFNNLLTGILGNANLARSSTSPSEIDAYLEQIERSTERAADLCGQMLAYAGKGRFEVAEVDLSAAVQETTSLIRSSIGRNVTLNLQLGRELPLVEGDLTQIRQIIMNLVLNASEAIEDRPGEIRITTGTMFADRAYLAGTHLAPDLPAGNYVFLEVADTGRGMSQETLGRIFDPFFSTKFTGRGLGLAAVLGIVRSHKGALRVESREGHGSTFRLLLPASTVPARAVAPVRQPTLAWHGRGLALVVDDEPSVRHVATRMLSSMGLDVVTTASGEEALERLRERASEFTVALLDLTMPGMRGDETYRQMQELRPDLPIIIMSGYSHQEASAQFKDHRLAGFLQKPFRLERLRELVREAIGPGREAAVAGRR